MATSKLNAEQFENLVTNFAGVLLVYSSINKEGVTVQTAQHFFGADYEAIDKSENEIFRVWKNIVQTFWDVKVKEMALREDNDGIRSKLRASTPTAIIFHTAEGVTVKKFNLESSVWQKIGLVPTKKDLERTARDYKKAIHAATKASFDALGFRVKLQKEAEKPAEKPAENETKNPQTIEQPQATQAAA